MTESKLPAVGKRAPAFSLSITESEKFKLSDFKGKKNVVIYFYPKDDTSGCTKEACAFRDDLPKFKRQDTVVVGISPDSLRSHEKFRVKYSLNFPLLADEEKVVCKKYGVWVEKSMYGRKYMGVQRATFLVDKAGKIAAAWPKVKVEGHVDEVLNAVKQINKS